MSDLSESKRSHLESSWAGTFRREMLLRIDEIPFSAMYSEMGSRPSTPVNVLLGWEILKSGLGLSDEDMYDRFLFDVQVR